jgi:hypothetical protein
VLGSLESLTARLPQTQTQLEGLHAAGVDKVFVDQASGTWTDRPELERCLKQLRQATRSPTGGSPVRYVTSRGAMVPPQIRAASVVISSLLSGRSA